MTTHLISTQFTQGMAFTATVNGHAVKMDSSSSEDGGTDSGASPKRLMLASLAGCTGMDVVAILNKMKVLFTHFTIDVEATLTEEHPKIYDQVKIIYKITIAGEHQPKMQKAVELSQEKYCGVSAMFKAFAKVKWEIVFG